MKDRLQLYPERIPARDPERFPGRHMLDWYMEFVAYLGLDPNDPFVYDEVADTPIHLEKMGINQIGGAKAAHALYDDTYVGKSLADLIDQMQTRHQELLVESAAPPASEEEAVSVIDLENFESEVDRTLPTAYFLIKLHN